MEKAPEGRTPAATADAWARFTPDAKRPWTAALAAHLLRRAGFEPSPSELRTALAAGTEGAVDAILTPAADIATFNRQQDALETSGTSARPLDELRGWWLRRMMLTPHPLSESMTLFWHGFFGVGSDDPDHALAHVRMLRAGALGRFDELVTAVLGDPAARLAAGGAVNYRARPNEVFARRVLSRFTVGDGAFTDRDVAETARALSGEFVRGGGARFVAYEHDTGSKTLLGSTGPWRAADVATITARHPAAVRRVVRALYRRFVSETDEPGDGRLEPLARDFAHDLDIGRLVGTILRSNAFFSPAAIRHRMKSPVEWAVGLCRTFGNIVPAVQLGRDLAGLGQVLYHPPTLVGWAGGRAWIDPATMIGRANLATALFAGSGAYAAGLDPAAGAGTAGTLAELMLPDGAPAGLRAEPGRHSQRAAGPAAGLRAMATLIASSPEYQLS